MPAAAISENDQNSACSTGDAVWCAQAVIELNSSDTAATISEPNPFWLMLAGFTVILGTAWYGRKN